MILPSWVSTHPIGAVHDSALPRLLLERRLQRAPPLLEALARLAGAQMGEKVSGDDWCGKHGSASARTRLTLASSFAQSTSSVVGNSYFSF